MKAQEIRPSILRLLYDMINADGIIHDKEIEKLEKLKEKYKIYPKDNDGSITYEAHKLTFSDALEKLIKWKHSEEYLYWEKTCKSQCKPFLFSVENILSDLSILATSDGDESSSEVLILLAYKYIVINEKATCFSCKERDLRFSKKEIIYIENEYNEQINNDIINNIELISYKLKLLGFDFIHIPQVRELLLEKDKQDLLKYAIRFMHPISVKDIDEAKVLSKELQKTTTDKFIKWYFNKNNINKSFSPSILIKLKKTRVAKEGTKTRYESFSDFLMIPIEHNIVNTIDSFTKMYLKRLETYTCNTVLNSNEMINGQGFHRTLLNYLVYKSFSGKVEEIIICYEEKRKEYIEFKGINQKCHLTSSEIAIYIIVLVMTYLKEYGGLCRDITHLDSKELGIIQNIYRNIANEDGKDIYTSIKTIIPKINKKITEVNKLEEFVCYQINNPRLSKKSASDNLKYSLNLNFNMVKFRFEGDITMSLDEWIKRYWDGIK